MCYEKFDTISMSQLMGQGISSNSFDLALLQIIPSSAPEQWISLAQVHDIFPSGSIAMMLGLCNIIPLILGSNHVLAPEHGALLCGLAMVLHIQ